VGLPYLGYRHLLASTQRSGPRIPLNSRATSWVSRASVMWVGYRIAPILLKGEILGNPSPSIAAQEARAIQASSIENSRLV
jgi:hypothetical protein